MSKSKLGAHIMQSGDPKRWVNAGSHIFKFAPETLGASSQVPAGALVIGKLDQTDNALNLRDWKAYCRDGWQPQATAQFRFNAQLAVYAGSNKPPVNRYTANLRIDAWEYDNEVTGDNPQEAQWLSAYSIEMMKLFDSIGKKYVLFNFAVGTPQLEMWQHLLPAVRYARDKGHYLGLHEYMGYEADYGVGWRQIDASRQPISVWHGRKLPNGQPDETRPYGWAALRYRLIWDTIFKPAGLGDVRLLVTELGCDSVESVTPVGKSVGTWKEHRAAWIAEGKDPELTYAGMLKQYDSWIREDSYVVGATIFTVGSVGNWENWDIANTRVEGDLLYYLKAINSLPEPPTEPPQPPQEPPVEPPVEQYKAIYVLCPSSATLPQMKAIQAKWYAKGRTIGRSIDDAISLMESPRTRNNSYILVHGWKYFSKAEQAIIKRYNYKLDYLPGDQPTTPPEPEPEPPAGPVIGTDISKWQGAVDFKKMRAAGVQFCFIRCSYGTFEDERLYAYAPAALAAGMPYGFYAYYHPWQDPIEQADLIISLVNKYGVDFPVAVDLEEPKNVPGDYTARVKRCLDHLTAALGHKPIIYTSSGYWSGTLKSPSWGKEHDLWIAAWTDASKLAIPAPWSDWRFWQYTSDGKGADYGVSSARVDLNRWNGTAAQLAAYRIPRQTTPTGQTVDILPFIRANHRVQFDMGYQFTSGETGTQTTQVIHIDANNWLFVKGGGQYERLGLRQWNGQPWIFRFEDTSESETRFYAHYASNGGAIGAPWFPRFAEVGRWYETTKFVQHYLKAGCVKQNSGDVTDRIRLIAKPGIKVYPQSGRTLASVITLEWQGGEQYDLAEGRGNVGFRDANRDFWFMDDLHGREDRQWNKPGCLALGW